MSPSLSLHGRKLSRTWRRGLASFTFYKPPRPEEIGLWCLLVMIVTADCQTRLFMVSSMTSTFFRQYAVGGAKLMRYGELIDVPQYDEALILHGFEHLVGFHFWIQCSGSACDTSTGDNRSSSLFDQIQRLASGKTVKLTLHSCSCATSPWSAKSLLQG